MKLIQRTSRSYLFLSIAIFVLGGILLAFTLTTVMNRRLDEKLLYNKEIIAKRIKYDYPLTIFEEPEELTEQENRLYPRDTIIYKDTVILRATIEGIEGKEDYEKYRQLTAYETLQGTRYKIVARNSLVRNQVFITLITLATIIIILLLLTGLWFFNNRISKKLWTPFHKNLKKLKEFSIQDQKPLELQESDIDEFKDLNESVLGLTEKVQSDFNNLKEFTENASHEMQTPLAIMQSKIELLLQSENLNRDETKQLRSIYQAGKRLSKLNKTLLTLAKVENGQFSSKETVDITELINSKLELYEDFILQKKIKVTADIAPNFILETNSTLADMLITNLITNSIRHNIENGEINVTLKNMSLLITNSGADLNINPENLFNRFKKASTSPDSSGLGLAIVKKVCDINKWTIQYTYESNLHQLFVQF